MLKSILVLFFLTATGSVFATTWLVGPARSYKAPSKVASLVQNGDTVLIDTGTYTDSAFWTKNNLVLMGAGPGYAHCQNAVYGFKGIWTIAAGANNITIENMEFSGASISGGEGGNGAGIRAQGGSYFIRNCYFHDNQNGILCNPTLNNDSADVLIEYSTFAYNGCAPGDPSGCSPGYEHNMYIGSGYRSFTLWYSYSHGAIQGHNVKTRASNNYILYNRIMDLADGTSSYDIDIAQGGPTVIMGNLVEGGPNKVNNSIIAYNEGSTNAPPENLWLINNTIINDQSGGHFLFMPSLSGNDSTSNDTLTLVNNIIAGPGALFNGNTNFKLVDSSNNLITVSIPAVGLADAAGYDYHLTSTSPAINAATGVGYIYDIAPVTPFSLTPVWEYVDSVTTESRPTVGVIDIGAYEYGVATGVASINNLNDIFIYPNPANGSFLVQRSLSTTSTVAKLFDIQGRLVTAKEPVAGNPRILFETASLAPGIYFLQVENGMNREVKRVVIAR